MKTEMQQHFLLILLEIVMYQFTLLGKKVLLQPAATCFWKQAAAATVFVSSRFAGC